jgi:hypothetical protein
VREIKTKEDVAAMVLCGVRPELAALAKQKLQDIESAFNLLGATYDPDVDGFVLLLEHGDDIAAITDFATASAVRGLAEHVEHHDGANAWEAIVCTSNSWAWTYILPDELPLPEDVAAELARQASRPDMLQSPAELAPF